MRDGSEPARDAAETLVGIERRAGADGAFFSLAATSGADVGFFIVLLDGRRLEVVYLATDPEAWGRGVAGRLLEHIDGLARSHGIADLGLWVIEDNHRAVTVYERAGWTSTARTRPHESPGRRERLMRRRLR